MSTHGDGQPRPSPGTGGPGPRPEEILLELPRAKRARRQDPMHLALVRSSGTPARLRNTCDPLRTISALGFAQYLRATKGFSSALNEARRYDAGDDEALRDESCDPSRTALDRSRVRLDVVSMLLHRRQMHADAAADAIQAISLYSDASPVTGQELQGMVMDVVYKSGHIETTVLPGASLAYGQHDAVTKGICLAWAAWLVAGPSEEHMRYFFRMVCSITTDGGVELRLLELPDFLRAFCSWAKGMPLARCAGLVDAGTSLWPRALRIWGWSHTLGGVMKEAAKAHPHWPDVLHRSASFGQILPCGRVEEPHNTFTCGATR